jgi:hypothetical protein
MALVSFSIGTAVWSEPLWGCTCPKAQVPEGPDFPRNPLKRVGAFLPCFMPMTTIAAFVLDEVLTERSGF